MEFSCPSCNAFFDNLGINIDDVTCPSCGTLFKPSCVTSAASKLESTYDKLHSLSDDALLEALDSGKATYSRELIYYELAKRNLHTRKAKVLLLLNLYRERDKDSFAPYMKCIGQVYSDEEISHLASSISLHIQARNSMNRRITYDLSEMSFIDEILPLANLCIRHLQNFEENADANAP